MYMYLPSSRTVGTSRYRCHSTGTGAGTGGPVRLYSTSRNLLVKELN